MPKKRSNLSLQSDSDDNYNPVTKNPPSDLSNEEEISFEEDTSSTSSKSNSLDHINPTQVYQLQREKKNKKKIKRKKKKKKKKKEQNIKNPTKKSLCSYFNYLVMGFVGLAVFCTMFLFLYGNLALGVYVRVRVWYNKHNLDNNINNMAAVGPVLQNINITRGDSLVEEFITVKDLVELKNQLMPVMVGATNSKYLYSGRVFKFNLKSSINDFMDSKAYYLAIIIAAWSGAWPYLKLLILLIIWFIPMSYIKKEWTLIFLDQLGKFSFIDSFVSTMMILSFQLNLKLDGLNIDIIVEPDAGFNVFVIATALTSLYSHVFLYWMEYKLKPKYLGEINSKLLMTYRRELQYHAKVVSRDVEDSIPQDPHRIGLLANRDQSSSDVSILKQYQKLKAPGPTTVSKKPQIGTESNTIELEKQNNIFNHINKSILQTSIFDTLYTPHPWLNDKRCFFKKYIPTNYSHMILHSIIMVLLFLCLILNAICVTSTPVTFDVGGLAGTVLGDESALRAYKTWQVCTKLPSSTDRIKSAYFQLIIYMILVIIMPFVSNILMIIIWFYPMKWKTLKHCLFWLLPCQAFSCMDVFFVACLAAAKQLQLVSKWIIDENFPVACGSDGFIHNCFSVQGGLTIYTYIMVGTIILMWVCAIYTLKSVNNAQRILQKKIM